MAGFRSSAMQSIALKGAAAAYTQAATEQGFAVAPAKTMADILTIKATPGFVAPVRQSKWAQFREAVLKPVGAIVAGAVTVGLIAKGIAGAVQRRAQTASETAVQLAQMGLTPDVLEQQALTTAARRNMQEQGWYMTDEGRWLKSTGGVAPVFTAGMPGYIWPAEEVQVPGEAGLLAGVATAGGVTPSGGGGFWKTALDVLDSRALAAVIIGTGVFGGGVAAGAGALGAGALISHEMQDTAALTVAAVPEPAGFAVSPGVTPGGAIPLTNKMLYDLM